MRSILIVLAFVSLAALALALPRTLPARASSNTVAESASAGSCVDRYNSLLKNAKAALAGGDRNTTVDLLQRAKRLIPACPGLQDGQRSVAALQSL